jgi:hypothetical protein
VTSGTNGGKSGLKITLVNVAGDEKTVWVYNGTDGTDGVDGVDDGWVVKDVTSGVKDGKSGLKITFVKLDGSGTKEEWVYNGTDGMDGLAGTQWVMVPTNLPKPNDYLAWAKIETRDDGKLDTVLARFPDSQVPIPAYTNNAPFPYQGRWMMWAFDSAQGGFVAQELDIEANQYSAYITEYDFYYILHIPRQAKDKEGLPKFYPGTPQSGVQLPMIEGMGDIKLPKWVEGDEYAQLVFKMLGFAKVSGIGAALEARLITDDLKYNYMKSFTDYTSNPTTNPTSFTDPKWNWANPVLKAPNITDKKNGSDINSAGENLAVLFSINRPFHPTFDNNQYKIKLVNTRGDELGIVSLGKATILTGSGLLTKAYNTVEDSVYYAVISAKETPSATDLSGVPFGKSVYYRVKLQDVTVPNGETIEIKDFYSDYSPYALGFEQGTPGQVPILKVANVDVAGDPATGYTVNIPASAAGPGKSVLFASDVFDYFLESTAAGVMTADRQQFNATAGSTFPLSVYSLQYDGSVYKVDITVTVAPATTPTPTPPTPGS